MKLDKVKILSILVALLICINLATLAGVWMMRPPIPHGFGAMSPKEFIITKLEFTDEQAEAFELLRKSHFDTIQKLRSASTNCGGNTLFQLSWMPISFEITSRMNTIGYDLPYHDTISLKDGIKITKSLLEKPPAMLILQDEYFNYKGPFPAKGMKYIFQNISKILEKYELKEELKDLDNNFKVYCLKKYNHYH